MKLFLISTILAGLFLASNGCGTPRIKGGSSNHVSPTGTTTLVQSEDPKVSSNSDTSSKISREYLVPASSIVEITKSNEPPVIIRLSTNMIIKELIEDSSKIKIGESNKNTAQEIASIMNGMKPIMFLGFGLVLFGLATLHPKVKLILQFSNTQSLITILGGLVLIFLPMFIVQHGTLILISVVSAVVGYIFVYRYSKSSTQAKILKDWIDTNNNGIKDEGE